VAEDAHYEHYAVWTKTTTTESQTSRAIADPLVPVWSTSKGPAAVTLLYVLEKHDLWLHDSVRTCWPNFPVDGSFGQLLSHQIGLVTLDEVVSVFDYDAVISAIEKQSPAWSLDGSHGYSPRLWGFLLDECVRRLTSQRLGQVWNEQIATPLGLDVWIGLPESEWPRVQSVRPGKLVARPDEAHFARAYSTAGSLTQRAFRGLKGAQAISDFNDPATWMAAWPAFGGLASAAGLAHFYHLLARAIQEEDIHGFFSPRLLQALFTPLSTGIDHILCHQTCFSAGLMMDPLDPISGEKKRTLFGPSLRAFGHPGAGGSIALADPDFARGLAYVTSWLEPGVWPNQTTQAELARLMAAD
jgi:CubicO group peptidase (beta-lactamase class C family)